MSAPNNDTINSVIITLNLKSKCSTRKIKLSGSDLDDASSKFLSNPMLVSYFKALKYNGELTSESENSYSDLEKLAEFNRFHHLPTGFFYDGYTCCQFEIHSIETVTASIPKTTKSLIRRIIDRVKQKFS